MLKQIYAAELNVLSCDEDVNNSVGGGFRFQFVCNVAQAQTA